MVVLMLICESTKLDDTVFFSEGNFAPYMQQS